MKKFNLLICYVLISFIGISATYAQELGSPANPNANAGDGMATLSWDVVTGATSYNLYLSRHSGVNNSNYLTRAGMKLENVKSPYKLTGINNDITYYFVVTAKNNSSESSPSNEVSATPQTTSNNAILFEDISTAAGLSQTKSNAFGNSVWGDINNDGNLDFIDTHHQKSISVYLNNTDETFKDRTEDSGITNTLYKYDRHGLALGDYDNDGNIDLFIALGSSGGTSQIFSQLWKGDGTGYFSDAASDSGIQINQMRDARWLDYNNDGYLDLFSSAEGDERGGGVYKNKGNGTFEEVTDLTGLIGGFNMVLSFADYNNDGKMDFLTCGRSIDKLYTNNGDGTFSLSASFSGGNMGRGVAWGDYNNDGFIDLFIARGQNDYHKTLFWNETTINFAFTQYPDPGEVTFRCDDQVDNITFDLKMGGMFPQTQYIFIGSDKENPSKTPFTLSADEATGKPEINAGDEDGFFVWRDESDNIWHIQWTESSGTHGFWGEITSDGEFTQVETNVSSLFATNYRSTLYRNNGDGTFTDVTEESGTGHIGNNNGVTWGDFDNDGLLDLYVVDAGDVLGNRVNTLYHNIGNGKFEDITSASGVSAVDATGRHYGVSTGDFNNDGALDLWLSNGYGWGNPLCLGKSMLLKNSGNENNWIKLKLVGTKSNKSGIGVRVVLDIGDEIKSRQLNGTGGELYSQGLAPVHFGLGQVSEIDSITIYWPSGIVQKLYNISANQELTITESGQVPTPSPSPSPTETIIPSPSITLLPSPIPSATPIPTQQPTPVTTGKISGSVIDTKGTAVASVKLEIKGIKTKFSTTIQTGADGQFEFTDLKADTYVITGKKKGYKKAKWKIKLEKGEEKTDVQIEMKKVKGKKRR